MQRFGFYAPEDYDQGVYINTRRNILQTVSPYTITNVTLDAATQPSTSTYFGTSLLPQPNPWTFVSGRDYETTTPYAVYPIKANITTGVYAVDVVFDTSLAGVFANTYVDSQNLPSVSTYSPQAGATVIEHIPLNGIIGQTISLYHSGFADKHGQTILGPINYVGQTIRPGVTLTPNTNTPIQSDNWIVTANATNWSLTRASTSTVTPYGYNTPLANIIPGFNVFVSNNSINTNDKASIATYPGKLDLLYYTVYTALAPNGQWITPIMDSGDSNTNWEFSKYNSTSQSVSTYLTSFQAGQSASPDATWQNIIPPTIASNDFKASQNTPAYRSNVVNLGQLNGRYGQGTFTINAYEDVLQNVEFYAWNPLNDPSMHLQSPVVQGSNMQQFMAAFTMALTDWQIKYQRFINSFTISSSDREYLFQKGQLLNTPIHLNETQTQYQNRLEIVAQGMTQAGTLAYMQTAIQAYCNTNAAYIKELAHSNITWALGTSQLGINTYLGNANVNVWAYEVHVPGSGNYDWDGLKKFVYYLNPVGAVPVFIFE